MHPFGGSTICPRCSKAVYAAEQVMGPGRKIYHKSCLTCYSCKRRLDSFSLVEHNEEPYCRPCHVREFGTRDLRSANISPQASPQAHWGNNKAATASSPPGQPALEVGADDSIEIDSSPDPDAQRSHTPTTPAEEYADQLSDIPASPPKRSVAFEGAGKSTQSIYPQSTGGIYLRRSPPQFLTASMTGGMFSSPERAGRTKAFVSASPTCPRCGKAVYFAEQVNAIGKKWHKSCLTCTACNKRLDSSTLLDHGDEQSLPHTKFRYTRPPQRKPLSHNHTLDKFPDYKHLLAYAELSVDGSIHIHHPRARHGDVKCIRGRFEDQPAGFKIECCPFDFGFCLRPTIIHDPIRYYGRGG